MVTSENFEPLMRKDFPSIVGAPDINSFLPYILEFKYNNPEFEEEEKISNSLEIYQQNIKLLQAGTLTPELKIKYQNNVESLKEYFKKLYEPIPSNNIYTALADNKVDLDVRMNNNKEAWKKREEEKEWKRAFAAAFQKMIERGGPMQITCDGMASEGRVNRGDACDIHYPGLYFPVR